MILPLAFLLAAAAPPTVIAVAVDKPGAPVPRTLFGVFFEDINFAADGGLYPERIKNRSFEFPDPLLGWSRAFASGTASFSVETARPAEKAGPHFLRIEARGDQLVGVANDGFRGIGVEKDARYTLSFLARTAGESARVKADVEVRNGRSSLAAAAVEVRGGEWRRYTATLTATATNAQTRLRLLVEGPATVDIDAVSLMPETTTVGLRPDLVQLLKELKPGFLRFPGGCIVEGRHLAGRYQWKLTIGDDRSLLINRWNNEYLHRPAPDYYQSFGLGFYEYFRLAEELGAEPLPILNCGMACQWNSSELASLEDLDAYVQDALDLVEFANGAVTTPWGRRRAELGHPEPFGMKFLGVGNEQWGPQYVERYERFAQVLKKRHPEVRLAASSGPSPDDERFHFLWKRFRELGADLVDEHYYMPPDWFFKNVGRYDSYPRQGPKVFAGEFAAHLTPPGQAIRVSTLGVALAEAAYMTGLERNADVVELASYAPLLAHVDAWQWTPNLIWFDNLRAFGTPSYYVQQLFGAHRGTRLLPVSVGGAASNGAGGLYTSAMLDEKAGEVVLKIVNAETAEKAVRIDLPGARGAARAWILTGDPEAMNDLANPRRVAPAEREVSLAEVTVPASSLVVVRAAAR